MEEKKVPIHSSYSLDSFFNPGTKQRAELLDLARNAERAERFNDLIRIMSDLVAVAEQDLTTEERDLLCLGFSKILNSYRDSWLALKKQIVFEQDNDAEAGTDFASVLVDYKLQTEQKMRQVCDTGLHIFEDVLLQKFKATAALTSRVVFLKTVADYHRYKSELGDALEGKAAIEYYKKALNVAEHEAKLGTNSKYLLDVVLNYSVCMEMQNNVSNAVNFAKSAFDQAVDKLESLDEANYKDTTLILQLIRDNVTLWTSRSGSKGGSSSRSQ